MPPSNKCTIRWFNPKSKKYGHVFFDGICGICNHSIDFLLKIDKHDVLTFSPLQGEKAKSQIPLNLHRDLSTIIYKTPNKTYTKSNAVIHILSDIGGIWKFALLLKTIPLPLRNFIYTLIAKNRYQWFGKKENCRIPTTEERGKILE